MSKHQVSPVHYAPIANPPVSGSTNGYVAQTLNYAKLNILTCSTNNSYQWTVSSNSSTMLSNRVLDTASTIFSPDTIRSVLRGGGLSISDTEILVERDGNLIIERVMNDGKTHRKFVPERYRGQIDLQSRFLDMDKSCTIRLPDGSIIYTGSDGKLIHEKIEGAEEKTIRVTGGTMSLYECLAFCTFGDIHVPRGCNTETQFTLPNGTVLTLGLNDKIVVNDKDAKVLYESPETRRFNRYLNASDLLEDFVGFCGQNNLSKKEFSELPLEIFIYWLIVRAAEADGDSTDEVLPLLTTAVKESNLHGARCKCCGKYLPKKFVDNGINFCSTDHMAQFMDRKDLS